MTLFCCSFISFNCSFRNIFPRVQLFQSIPVLNLRILINFFYCFIDTLDEPLGRAVSHDHHIRRKHLFYSPHIVADHKEATARSLQIGYAKGLRETRVDEDLAFHEDVSDLIIRNRSIENHLRFKFVFLYHVLNQDFHFSVSRQVENKGFVLFAKYRDNVD